VEDSYGDQDTCDQARDGGQMPLHPEDAHGDEQNAKRKRRPCRGEKPMMSRIIALRPFGNGLEEKTHQGCARKGDLNGHKIYDVPPLRRKE
jgi:hypothetical protein